MLNKEQFNAFILEIATFGNIPISSKNCGIGCIYCKVHSDPILKRYPPIPVISLDDLYEGFKYVDNNSKYLRLGAGVLVAPHTDPYLHPLIYDFIKHTADFFPKKMITTVTTGSYIEETKVDFLNDEDFSLTKDTDSGKQSNTDIVFKYMRVIDDELVGAGGTPKDNIKHLQGAVRLIRRSLTDTNPALDLLNAFCLFYLGTYNNKTLENELIDSYSNGLYDFKERENNIVEFWHFFDRLNTEIDRRAKDFPNKQFIEIKNIVNLEIHAEIIKEITNKYIL